MGNDPEKNSSSEKEKKGEFWRFMGVASTIGINMVASTFVGFAIGYWVLDSYLNTLPWFTIFFTLVGIAAGFKYMFKVAKKAGERNSE
jgi:ATP synthase protein I